MTYFRVFRAAGSQTDWIATTSAATPHASAAACRRMGNGTYTVRDVLGGLRYRIEMKDGNAKFIDRTPKG